MGGLGVRSRLDRHQILLRELDEGIHILVGVGVAERSTDPADRLAAGVRAERLERDGVGLDRVVVHALVVVDGVPEHSLVDARVAEAARADVDACRVRRLLEEPGVLYRVTTLDGERDRVVAARRVDDDGLVADARLTKLVVETAREARGMRLRLAQVPHELETVRHGGDHPEVDGTVLVASVPERLRGVEVLHHRDKQDAAAGEVFLVHDLVRPLSDEQTPDARREPEQFVEADRDEVRLDLAQVEAIVRHVRGGVEEHIPALGLGDRHPVQGVHRSGVVALGRHGEQLVAGRARVREHPRKRRLVELETLGDRRVPVDGPRTLGRLAQPVDGVVLIGREQELAALELEVLEETDRPRRVGREDDLVLGRVRVDVREHGGAGLMHLVHRTGGGPVVGVRISDDGLPQEVGVLIDQERGRQSSPGPVDVHLPSLKLGKLPYQNVTVHLHSPSIPSKEDVGLYQKTKKKSSLDS